MLKLKEYKKAMDLMPRPNLNDLSAEAGELIEKPSMEELFDVLHTLCRMLRLPSTLTYSIAKPTAMKHAVRFAERGCPRSERNCKAAGPSCCCKASLRRPSSI